MVVEELSQRRLNRATLARQLLLERASVPVAEAVERVAGLQAQTAHSWYVSLWSRIDAFEAASASDLLESRALVRIALMRSTIHLVTARDCLAWRPLMDPVIERVTQSAFGKHLVGLELDAVAAAGRELVEAGPLTFSALGRSLVERFPGGDPSAMGQLVRARVALSRSRRAACGGAADPSHTPARRTGWARRWRPTRRSRSSWPAIWPPSVRPRSWTFRCTAA